MDYGTGRGRCDPCVQHAPTWKNIAFEGIAASGPPRKVAKRAEKPRSGYSVRGADLPRSSRAGLVVRRPAAGARPPTPPQGKGAGPSRLFTSIRPRWTTREAGHSGVLRGLPAGPTPYRLVINSKRHYIINVLGSLPPHLRERFFGTAPIASKGSERESSVQSGPIAAAPDPVEVAPAAHTSVRRDGPQGGRRGQAHGLPHKSCRPRGSADHAPSRSIPDPFEPKGMGWRRRAGLKSHRAR